MNRTRKAVSVLALAIALPFATGCGAAGSTSGGAPATAAGAKVERRMLAEGVELVVSEDAGVEARRIVEEFQAEMRARYISAR